MGIAESNPVWISIVIPAFNRASVLPRVLRSCLQQDLTATEIIVVDDGSTDGTAAVLTSMAHPALKPVRHEQNRGVSAARATGVTHAHGEWVLCLDSDDELLPGALALISERVKRAPATVHRLCFSYVTERGTTVPEPHPGEVVLTYVGYLRWLENVSASDFSNCIRRCTFTSVPFPVKRVYETGYHSDFARRYQSEFFTDAVGLIHSDASNRSSNSTFRSLLRDQRMMARDLALEYARIVEDHGAAMAKHCPRIYRSLVRRSIQTSFLAGGRRSGIREALHSGPSVLAPSLAVTALLGAVSPSLLGAAAALRRRP